LSVILKDQKEEAMDLFTETLTAFENQIFSWHEKLLQIDDDEAVRKSSPEKWSIKEIIGHLIDSASNNHQRFVRAQFSDDLVFPGYQQDDWISVQNYQNESWKNLIELWKSFNLHILHVMKTANESKRKQIRLKHNLHQLAWKTVPENEPATLEYFMLDYIGHFNHHLNQVAGSKK